MGRVFIESIFLSRESNSQAEGVIQDVFSSADVATSATATSFTPLDPNGNVVVVTAVTGMALVQIAPAATTVFDPSRAKIIMAGADQAFFYSKDQKISVREVT
jgi:hypothetical protein